MARILKQTDVGARTLVPYEREVLDEVSIGGREPVENPLDARERILGDARLEAERKVCEAYEEGMRRGLEAGRAAFEESIAQCAKALESAAGELVAARQAFLESLEPEVLQLTRTIIAVVLEREARTDPELVRTTARRALEALLDRECVTVRLNPGDLEALRVHTVRLLDEFDGVHSIEVLADETVSPGGCIATSQLMHVDACLERQLERIFEELARIPSDNEDARGNTI
ncbi:MAG TPA: hypothetical protein ENN80_04955 [Candidatus Hydrogenedentes bacterium]|nr:hypothetical protein [Candidatus Hydrogenedentota bacterium]